MSSRVTLTLLMAFGLASGTAAAETCSYEADAIGTLVAVVAQLESGEKEDVVSHRPTSAGMQSVYDANAVRAEEWLPRLSGSQASDLELFLNNWKANKAKYERVAAAADLPAELVAAIHWRESTADFSTYLHQGDPLGRPAVNWPTNIPVFHNWEDAAIHALKSKDYVADALSLDASTEELAALTTYAEYYNGLGYSYRDKPSPYVWAGTDQYKRGKFVADGRYNGWTKDSQLGVTIMIQGIRDLEQAPQS